MKVLGLVLLIACTPPPPEPLVNSAKAPVVYERPHTIAAPRPELDLSALLPDPTEHARWPLSATAHPAFEPRFNIASALAEPGIGWIDLCRMGAQNRTLSSGRDLQAYLGAWCTAANGDTAEAFAKLAVIGTTITSGMAPAVREDLANLLVQHGDADAAERLLAKAKIEDIEVFDLLAASYFEVGKPADANEINDRAIDRQDRAKSSDAAKCHRYARKLILASPEMRSLKELDALGNEPVRFVKNLSTDPDCAGLFDEIACWDSPVSGCGNYIYTQHLDSRYRFLFAAYFSWPPRDTTFRDWMGTADAARQAIALPGAARLEAAALIAAFRVVPCTDLSGLVDLRVMTRVLRTEPTRDPSSDPQLDRIISSSVEMAKSITICESKRWPL